MFKNFFSAAKRFIAMSVTLKFGEIFYQDTVASIFRRNVAMHPNKVAFLMGDIKLTFQEVRTALFIRTKFLPT